MSQITRDNHFVPQLYLKQWSEDRSRIWSYRILVSDEGVKKWQLRPIRGVAVHRDLYTTISNGEEIDEFEKWLEAEFETPVQSSITKVTREKPLKSSDWVKLVRFLAAQDVRTPTSYFESMKRWEKTLPDILKNTLDKSIKELEKSRETKVPLQIVDPPTSMFKNALKVNITPNISSEEGGGIIEAQVVTGRALWIESQRFLLQNTAKVLLNHKWSIVKPANGFEWFTSDHPVARLNYYEKDSYDLKGGWGKKGANLLMPLSPYHLLFTQIGTEFPDRFSFSKEQTIEIQKIFAGRALRWIFSKRPMKTIEKYRPRHVNRDAYTYEEEQIKKWHKEQMEAEK
jgi:hypothetical protein